MAIDTDRFEQIELVSAAQCRDWLTNNHTPTESVWAVTFLKSVPARYVYRFQLLDQALCFGWIDGLRRKLDDTRTIQLFSPRRHQCWTESYRLRVEWLEHNGLLAPSGMAAIAASKQAGTCLSLADVDALVVPEDLSAALTASAPGSDNFDGFPPSHRRNALRWVARAKTAPTRAKRISQLAMPSAENRRVPTL